MGDGGAVEPGRSEVDRYNPAMPVLLVQCSCPDGDTADVIAATLVNERLAACVQRLPGVRSTYRWQGQVEHSDEVLLQIKTTRERLGALIARVQALHPHELPEVVAVEVAGGLPAYLDWVAGQTGDPEPRTAP